MKEKMYAWNRQKLASSYSFYKQHSRKSIPNAYLANVVFTEAIPYGNALRD